MTCFNKKIFIKRLMIIRLNKQCQKVCRHAIIYPDKHAQETIFNEEILHTFTGKKMNLLKFFKE